jgi:hypothetical protein
MRRIEKGLARHNQIFGADRVEQMHAAVADDKR